MAERESRIAPLDVIAQVDHWISAQIDSARRYENSELLDESGAWSLHALAAQIYARGWRDGEMAESNRAHGQRGRDRDSERHGEASADEDPNDHS